MSTRDFEGETIAIGNNDEKARSKDAREMEIRRLLRIPSARLNKIPSRSRIVCKRAKPIEVGISMGISTNEK